MPLNIVLGPVVIVIKFNIQYICTKKGGTSNTVVIHPPNVGNMSITFKLILFILPHRLSSFIFIEILQLDHYVRNNYI